jgi:glycosyltransferase involved in cell wall biosynthesis
MICIVRPYANLPSDGAGNDRYVNLCVHLRGRSMDAHLVCSSFIHNRKARRTDAEILTNRAALPFVTELNSVGYRNNASIGRVLYELVFGLRALRWVWRNRPASILVGEPLFFVGWLFVAFGWFSGIPISADVIDLWPEADTRELRGASGAIKRMIYRALKWSRAARFNRYSSLTFVSNSYAEAIRASKPRSVFYWGSDLVPNGGLERPSGGTVTIVYAGSFGNGYDIQTVLDAARLLAAHQSGKYRIVFAGGGEQEQAVKESARRGEIEYLGYIDKPRLIQLYGRSDIGLLPYKAGSMVAMPIKFFDYVNFGIYSISSLTLEVADVIRSKAIGAYYKAGDVQDLYARIIETAADASRRERVRSVCAQLRDYYSLTRQYGGFAEFVAGRAGDGSSMR